MFNPANLVKFCEREEIPFIENYDKAVNSKELYIVHHKIELEDENGNKRDVPLKQADLLQMGLWFKCGPKALIFLTQEEHSILHGNPLLKNTSVKGRRGQTFGSRGRAVKCIETGEIFNSTLSASKKLGVNQSAISSVLCGKRKSVNKYHFEEVTDPTILANLYRPNPGRTPKKVRCIETGEVFISALEAANKYGITGASVRKAVHDGTTCMGLHWEKVNE